MFKILSCGFAFIIGSCLFKTFFSSFFSILLFLYSIKTFFAIEDRVDQPLFCKIGLALFSWILLSISWSSADILSSLQFLSEYRLFVLIPIVAVAFDFYRVQPWVLLAFTVGCLIALMASYGLRFGILEITGAELSLANRIFHGFLMSIFFFGILTAAAGSENKKIKTILYTLAAAVFYNVVNIESGRTGYILIIAMLMLFIILSNDKKGALVGVSFAVGFILIAFLVFDSFNTRVSYTLLNVYNIFFGDADSVLHTSAGNRIEFYTMALKFGFENPLLGLGVGDVEEFLSAKFTSGEIKLLTDNVHNEYLNMLLIGGIPAVFLYVCFLLAMFSYGLELQKKDEAFGWIFIAVALWLGIASIFNSSVKDFGDKQLVILAVSWLLSCAMRINADESPLDFSGKFKLGFLRRHSGG